jgi:hypothetical protein
MKLLNIFIAMILTILARIIKYIKVLLDEILLGEIFEVVGKKKFEICLGQ